MITIVDYKMGNIASIINMIKKIGYKAMLSSRIEDIEQASKLILPGVGAFDNGMKNLDEMGFIPVLNKKALEDKTPIIGICLGMQLLTERSDEGELPGLGWIKSETVKFKFDNGVKNLKVPHMGWNTVDPKKGSALFSGLEEDNRFYFVHSYHVICKDESDILGKTHYGYDFTSSVHRDNIYGVQFHPEKSHKFGMNLLKNFLE